MSGINRHRASLLLGMLWWLCAACGPLPAPGAASSTPAPLSGTISFMVFGDPAELKAYQALVSAFEARDPRLRVDLVHIPSQVDYLTRLGTDFAAGTPADVFLLNYRRVPGFAAKGALAPLDDYLARSRQLSAGAFYPAALEAFRWQDQLLCIPQNVSSLVVYYNRRLFEAAGLATPRDDWTWDEFLRAAQALTKDTDGDGRTDQYGFGTEVSLQRVAPFIWQNGGDVLDAPVRATRLRLDAPPALEAIQWFADLQLKHHVAPNLVEEKAQDSESRFQNGTLAMYLNSRRGVTTYRAIRSFDWDVAPLPRGRVAASVLHADGYCVPSSARDKDAIWNFVEFANGAEGQALVAATGRTVPSLRAVAESPAFLNPAAKPANSRIFLSVIPEVRALPLHAQWADIEDLTTKELERAYYGSASAAEAVRSAIERTTPFFGKP